jgi:HEAT repeat protein
MRFVTARLFLGVGLVLAIPSPVFAADAEQAAEDERLLKSFQLGIDGPALLEFFRKRTPNETVQRLIKELIDKLGDQSYKVRAKARADLVVLGRVALPLLREAARGTDLEVKKTAQKLVTDITRGDSSLPMAAARLLALRKPPGAVAILLAYVPFADDDLVAGEVSAALVSLALVKGKPEPFLLGALSDKEPIRRAIGAEVLCQAGVARQVPALYKLLRDPVATVRLRTALALAVTHDEAAIPVLIASLADLPRKYAGQAEEVLLQFAGALAPRVPLTDDEAGRKKCRDAWAQWWQKADAASLLDYFRKRTLPETGRERITGLVEKLGDRSYKVRRKAAAELVLLKNLAVPFLKEALKNSDPEVKRQAKRCLKVIVTTPEAPLSAANARLLALRKPDTAAKVLLAYLPFADDDGVVEEVCNTLATLADGSAKAKKTLLAALTEKLPLLRITAAEAICRSKQVGSLADIAKLLDDTKPRVRLRVALALSRRAEKKAIPTLIALLGELLPDEASQVEDVLRLLADNNAPDVALGENDAGRRKCRDAWEKWWEQNESKVDLARLSGHTNLGYTVVAQWNWRHGTNDLIELGRDRKPRRQLTGVRYSFDFEVLPSGRLLVIEHLAGRVVEQDFKGKIYWEYKVPSPVNCQRLPNGHTFIATPGFVVEVDRNKKEIYKINKSGIMAGGKSPEGRVIVIMSGGQCIHMDTNGKELKSFSIGSMGNYGGIEVLRQNHVIVSSHSQPKVVEFDADGKIVWQHPITQPGFSTRLRNGNTIITSQGGRYAVEVTRAGKVVWEYRPKQAIWRARRR